MKQTSKKQSAFRPLMALAAAVVLFAADQITKRLVLFYIKPKGAVPVLEGLLEFSYVENKGVAFGLLQGRSWFVAGITALATAAVLILLFRYRRHTFFSYATSALLLAGGCGNLVDRLQYGYVVDFIHVLFFDYVFNVADCCITVGAVLFAIHYLFFTGGNGKKEETGEECPVENDG